MSPASYRTAPPRRRRLAKPLPNRPAPSEGTNRPCSDPTYHRAMHSVRSLVSGQTTDAPGGVRTIANPARLDEIVSEAHLGDAETFLQACRVAKASQLAWSSVPAPVRGRAIQQLGRLVEDNAETLARLITQEIGKPIKESRGEIQEVIDTCSFFLGEGRRLYGMTVPSEMPDKQLFTFRTPVGVAAIITAGNFPVAVPSWYLVPALLCGNAVVWKPAEYTPAIADAFAQLILHAGLPEGTFQMVLTDGPETFAGLERALDEEVVDKVGFTGSTAVGERLGELCGRHLQTPCLELGGKNPLVVMPDADLDLAVEGALFSGFGTAGQRCTSLGTAIVHRDVHQDFVRPVHEGCRRGPDRRSDPRRPLRPDDRRALRGAVRGLARADPRSPSRARLERGGTDHANGPARGLRRRRSRSGLLLPPHDRRRRPGGRRPLSERDVRPDRRSREIRHVRRGDRTRQRAWVRLVVLDLHDRPAARVPLPRTRLRRDGQREQLHVRRRGAPPLRRQRPERQRVAAIGCLGARPVHAVAGDELGLLGSPPEGADGRRGRRRRPRPIACPSSYGDADALALGVGVDGVGVPLGAVVVPARSSPPHPPHPARP